ncbi:hypothetical protein Bca4012_059054 [Brassica carinata]
MNVVVTKLLWFWETRHRDNAKFCSCGGDQQVYYWDVSIGRVIRKFRSHDGEVNLFPTRKHQFVTDRGSFSLTERHQTSLLKQPQHHSLLPITYGDVSVGEETTISEEGREPKKARNA